jgi:MFS transporter, DHA1 family, tetracycline resistance protein
MMQRPAVRGDAALHDVVTQMVFNRLPIFLTVMPVPARIACLLYFVASVADGALMPFFALWALKIAGVEVGWIGVLLGCYAGGELVATPFIGGMADRVGRRPVLLASTAGVGVGFLLLLFANGPVTAAGCLIVIGIFESVLHPTAATVIGDVVAPERMTESYSVMRLASNAGAMVGPALGALFALLSLRFVFVGAALSVLLGTLCVALFLPETRPPSAKTDADEEESLTALTAIFHDRRLAALLIPIAALGICSSWIESVSPLYANTAGLLSESGVGWLFTYAGALGVLLQLPLVRATQRYPVFAVILGMGLVLSLAFVLLIPAPTMATLIGAVTGLALARILLGPLTNTLAFEMAPTHARATYQASFSVTSDLRDTLGPAIGTWLYAISARLPWVVAVPICLLASGLLAVLVRRHARPRDAK